MTNRSYLKTADVSKTLNLSRATVVRMCQRHELPGAIQIRGQWRIEPDRFERWLEAQHRENSSREKALAL